MAAFPTIFMTEEKLFKRKKHCLQNTSCIVLDILTSGRKTKQNKKQKKQLFVLHSPPEKGDKGAFCEFNLLRKYMDCGLTKRSKWKRGC